MERSRNSAVAQHSGNAFADFRLPNGDELGTKERLAASVNALLTKRKLTQVQAAHVLGITQPKVSALRSGKLEGFSLERLMHFVTALEHDVVIVILTRTKAKGEARVRVIAAA